MLLELGASAAFGGIGTVALSHWLNRANADLICFSVNIECPQLPDSKMAEVAAQELYRKRGRDFCYPSQELITLLDEEHSYISAPDEVYRHYQQYTSFIYETLNENAKIREGLVRMNEAIEKAYDLHKARRHKEAYEVLSKTDIKWWGPLMGEARRLNFNLDDIDDRELDNAKILHNLISHPITENGHTRKIPVINLGLRSLAFPFSSNETAACVEFANKAAKIFASENTSGLGKIFEFLKNHEWIPTYFDKTENLLEDELLQYSRVVFRGAIANRGRSAVAVQRGGEFVVNSSGSDYVDAGGGTVSLVDDIKLECLLVDDTGVRAAGAVSVGPGSIEPVTMISVKRINQMDDPEPLLAMFYRSRVNFTTAVPATLKKPLRSTSLFRPEATIKSS